MSYPPEEPVAELQWLEDGVNLLAAYTFNCIKAIVLGVVQLYRHWRG